MNGRQEQRSERGYRPHDKSPEQIEQELEETRIAMDGTLEALIDKFAQGELFDRAKRYIGKESSVGDFGRNFSTAVTNNPVPLTLLGIGLGWLMLSGRPERAHGAPLGVDPFQETSERLYEEPGAEAEEHRRYAVSRFSDRFGAGRNNARRLGDRMRHRASTFGEQVRHGTGNASSSMLRTFREQPVTIGLLGVAVGAAVGLAMHRRKAAPLSEHHEVEPISVYPPMPAAEGPYDVVPPKEEPPFH